MGGPAAFIPSLPGPVLCGFALCPVFTLGTMAQPPQLSRALKPKQGLPQHYYEGFLEKKGPRDKVGLSLPGLAMLWLQAWCLPKHPHVMPCPFMERPPEHVPGLGAARAWVPPPWCRPQS